MLAVDTDDAYSNLLLPRRLREEHLERRDAGFATELTYGALRWQGSCDEVIDACGSRPIGRLDPPVRAVLRLGAYQLMHMRVPEHAAVSTSVDLTRAMRAGHASGYVNAVLRKIAARPWSEWVDVLAPTERLGRLGFEYGYPRWIVAAFADALEGNHTELEALLRADRPVTHLVARPGRISRDELLEQAGHEARPGALSPYAVDLGAGGAPGDIPAVREGRAAVQDEGSQLAALIVAQAPIDGPDERWLDTCAGPGGKAALLGGLLPGGGRLVAADRAHHRAVLARSALRGGPDGWVVVTADGRRPAWPAGAFDRVLLDAPCSGLGALRRRPEVRWRRTPEAIAELTVLQGQLLDSALAAVRPGGIVGYVTCSPHLAETREAVAGALARQQGAIEVVRLETPWSVPGPFVQLWPHRNGTDAMFVAILRRTDMTGP
jgi:16S rRNA (cytosine967-C5)-methyltransferase